ncbi:hypothetical protein BH10BAC2_BH10BAC2_35130 [soil metagenome]
MINSTLLPLTMAQPQIPGLRVYRFLFRLVSFLFLTSFTLVSNYSWAQSGTGTISTDQLDYPPGSTAIITGSGFQPNETVTLQVKHDEADSLGTDPQYHQPWAVIADADGNVSSSWIVPDDGDAVGATFLLTADGQSSSLHAEWIFTDNPNITGVAVAVQSGNLCAGTAGSVTYIITVNRKTSGGGTAAFTANLCVNTALPAGVTASFSPASLSFVAGSSPPSLTSTLTLTSTAGTPVGLNSFTVRAYTGTATCTSNSGDNSEGSGNLLVNGVSITTQPVSQAVCSGSSMTFSVAAGAGTLTYQWRKNTVPIGGATSSSYTINPVAVGDAGTYNVIITNSVCGTATSSGAILTVNTAPVITTNPTTQTACNGSSITLTAAASGTPAPTVQWQLSTNGGATFNNITGATNTSLTIDVSTGGQPKQYKAIFTNSCGAATTNIAIITANTAPTFSGGSGPVNTSVNAGSSTSFSVTASGTSITYQWQLSTDNGFNFSNLSNVAPYSGVTTNTLNITNTPVSLNGNQYRCIVSSAVCPSATSNAATLTVINPCTTPTFTTSVTDVTCNGADNGSINLTPTGGTPAPFTYAWSNGAITEDVSGLAPGGYTVTVTTASGGCSATSGTITITEPTLLTGSATEGTILCYGGTTTVTVNATGGTAPYSGDGDHTVSAGPYSFIVTDANGCTVTVSGTVIQPTELTGSATEGTILCYGGTTTVTVNATGGTAPYSGDGDHTVSAGPYSFIVTDANGCIVTVSGTISQPTDLTGSATEGTILCYGGTTTVTVDATGGTAPYSGDGDHTVSAGPYSFIVTDANGCTVTVSGTISQPTQLTASATPSAILCYGGNSTVVVSANGGTAPYSGTGSFTHAAGTYSYTVTDANGCTVTVSGTISQPTQLTASATPSAILCYGGNSTVVVSANGGTAPYSGTGSFTHAAGTYSYTVTDANGCTVTVSGTISQPTQVTASATPSLILCNGGNSTVVVSANGGTVPYSGTGSFTHASGPYSYTVTDANGCTVTVSGTISQPPALVADCLINNTELYFGYTGDQTATFSVSPSGGTGPYTVSITMNRALLCNQVNDAGDEVWNGGAGGTTTGNTCLAFPSTTSSTPVSTKTINTGSYGVTVTLMGDATLTATIADANGCVTSCSKFIHAEDVRCFAGKSNIAKVTLCHKTGSTKNPCVKICVDDDAVAEHLAHGDFLGNCTSNCLPPPSLAGSNTSVSYAGSRVLETKEPLKVKILPNPSTGRSEFTLRAEGNSNETMQIVVIDMYGKIVHTAKGTAYGDYRFGGQFVSGVYVVKVLHNNQVSTYKIVKTK